MFLYADYSGEHFQLPVFGCIVKSKFPGEFVTSGSTNEHKEFCRPWVVQHLTI